MKKTDIQNIVKESLTNIVDESSINRIKSWIDSYDIATLSACRYEFINATKNTLDDRPNELKQQDTNNGITDPMDKTSYIYTRSENNDRNRDLKAALLRMGYGVTKISGNYIENYKQANEKEVAELSFLVVNLSNDANFYNNIFKLSEYYNQDSFLYKAKNDDTAYLVGTNNGEFPGYTKKVSTGKFHINIDSEFLSRYKNRSFSFTDTSNPKNDTRPNNFNTRKQSRINNENIYPIMVDKWDDLQMMSKWCVSTIADSVIDKIKQFTNDNKMVKEDDNNEEPVKKQRGGRRANSVDFMRKNRGIGANKSLRGNVNKDGSKKQTFNDYGAVSKFCVTNRSLGNHFKLTSYHTTQQIPDMKMVKMVYFYDSAKTKRKLVALFNTTVRYGKIYQARAIVEFNEEGVKTTKYTYSNGYLIKVEKYDSTGEHVISTQNVELPKDTTLN